MAVELATAYVSLVPSFQGGAAAISQQMAGPAAAAGATAGKGFGQKFHTSLVKYGKVSGAGLAAVGVGLFSIGKTFKEVENTIIVGTGASGKALDGLVASAKNVGKDVPSNFGDIGTAVADLNTRLGLTGKPLEDMAAKFLNLSRITGTDLQQNINQTTRVFGDWGIATEDQSSALDVIFEATKRTGIGLDTLTNNVVQFGAPLRQMGFGFEESIALFAKWEREGVNTQTVLGGLRIGLGKLAKAGEDPPEAFRRIVASIEAAGSAGEANALSIEAFGARAGPDMAAAIREGRFEIDELVANLMASEGALGDADSRTRTFTESWQLFKNNAMLALEPVARRVFDVLGKGMEVLSKNQPVLIGLAAIVGTLLVASFTAWAVSVLAATWPILAIIAAVAGITAGILWLWNNVEGFRAFFTKTWEILRKVIAAVFDWVKRNWPLLLAILTGPIGLAVLAITKNWDTIKAGAVAVKDGVVRAFNGLRDGIKAALDWVKRNAIDPLVAGFQSVWDKAKEIRTGVTETFRKLRDAIGNIFEAAVEKIKAPIRSAFKWLNKNLIDNLNKVTGKFGLNIPKLPETFHTGGVIPGRGERIITALGGEGVVSPLGMRTLGRHGLDALNRGELPSGGPLDWVKDNIVDPAARGVAAIGSEIGGWLRKGAGFALDKIMGGVIGAAGLMPEGFSQELIVGTLRELRPLVKAWGEGKDQLADGTSSGSNSPAEIAASGWARPIGAGFRIGRGTAGHGYPALDLPAPTGTPIYAPTAGRVIQSLNSAVSYGNRVMMSTSAGRVVLAHMSRRVAQFGDVLRAGQLAGYVGSTGNSTGPHLHLEIGRNDPLSFLRRQGVTFDSGGYLPPGHTLVYNGTGGPERVLNRDETRAYEDRLNGGDINNFYGVREDVIIARLERRDRIKAAARR